MNELNRLLDMIDMLVDNGSYHKRRGFRLADATPMFTSNHLLEEMVEMQAEIIAGNDAATLEEASDVLLTFLHLLRLQGITLPALIDNAQVKLAMTFTTDKAEVTATEPGGTRRSRQ